MEIKGYSSLWKAVIRPPRAQYDMKDMGPADFIIDNLRIKRTDIELKNPHGHTLQCSHYEPHESHRQWTELPCVIYMHGNSSSRLEALDAVPYLLPSNISLFCFDFAGCGNSGGEYISLGWYEREDLNMIVEYLRKERNCSTIGLWGRSMGAVTALLHGDRDPSIGGMVLDSPFADMKQLVSELAKTYTKIPNFLVSAALKIVRSTIRSKANFDIFDLTPISHVKECFIPALFAVGLQDDFIQPHHAEELHAAYAGDKNIVKFEGDHNSQRPHFFFDSVVIFFYNTLQVSALLRDDNKRKRAPGRDSEGFLEIGPKMKGKQGEFPTRTAIDDIHAGLLSNAGDMIDFDDTHVNEEDLAAQFAINGSIVSSQRMGSMVPQYQQQEDDEDEIMKKIIEESIRSAQFEEEKRKAGSGEEETKVSHSKPTMAEKVKQLKPPGSGAADEEEHYLLECMQKIKIEEQQQRQQQQQPQSKSGGEDLINL